MKFERIRVERAPGIDQPFELSDFASGFNVVLGPNGSGKSLVCRVVRDLLWPSHGATGTAASADIGVSAGSIAVRCDEDAHEWNALDTGAQRPLLPKSHAAGCFLLHAGDLLSTSAGTDVEIAGEVKKQMAGGYDLDALRAGQFTVPAQHGKRARRALDDAQRGLALVHTEFRSLTADEESLAGLTRCIETAQQADERMRVLERLEQLAEERERLADIVASLGALPVGMEHLTGVEEQNLAEREANRVAATLELEETDAELELSRRQLGELKPAGEPTQPEDIAAWSERARKLARLEDHCAELGEAAAALEGAALERREQLSVDGDGPPFESPNAKWLDQLDDHLRMGLDNRIALAESSARLQALASASECVGSRDLKRALKALRDWCALPLSQRTMMRMRWLWSLGALAAGVGAWFVSAGEDRWLAACGFGVGLFIWAYSIGADARIGQAHRAEAEESFPARDVLPPEAWAQAEVQERLCEVEVELAKALAEEDRASGRTFLEQKLAELEEAEDELDLARESFASEIGLCAEVSSLSLVEVAQRLASWREASAESRAAAEKLRQAESTRTESRGALVAWLAARGYACEDSAGALEALRVFDERVRTATRLSEEITVLEARRPGLVEAIEECESRVARVFVDAGLENGDRTGLERRLSVRSQYHDLDRQGEVRKAQIDRLEASIPDAEERLDSTEVGEALRAVHESAAELEDLVAERAAAQERLRAARCGTRMEDALDEVATANERLVDQHEELLDACVGQLLIDSIEEEYRQSSSPEVLKRAAELFGKFTQHKYELQLDDAGSQTRFRARDVLRNRMLGLSELSDGTRMQLLLAARFAYALDVEEEPLPFFLDEALSFSDPERLAEIARVLFALVQDGRQIVYLTSRPGDVEVFRQAAMEVGCEAPKLLDLGAARGLGVIAEEECELAYELVPVAPPVGTDSAEEYGVRLGVPIPTPESVAGELHLFYLLRDDLDLLQRLVGTGCARLGQWHESVRAGAARTLCKEEPMKKLVARGQVAEMVFAAWSIGRGRRIGRSELLRSGAVSERYLDGLAELVAESQGGADKFLSSLEARNDDRAKGFQNKKIEELTLWLEENEFLDRRSRLDLEAARTRVLAGNERAIAEGRLLVEEVIDLTTSIWSALVQGETKQVSRKMSQEQPYGA